MTHEQRFRFIVRGLLAIGVTPTPTKLNRFLGRTRNRLNNINGREAAWRRQELLAAGWTAPVTTNANRYWDESPDHWTRWSPPS